MTDLPLVTSGFMTQLVYYTAVREALIGVDPTNSQLVYELNQFRYYRTGYVYIEGAKAIERALKMKKVIEDNHARVKMLVEMAEDKGQDRDAIARYIADLYRESEDALSILQELEIDGE